MVLRLTLLLLLLPLAGCSEAPAEPRRTRADRQAAAELKLSQTPQPRTYRFDGSELRVLEVPVSADGKWVDTQRCFLWRDAEFRTSSISCGAVPDLGPVEHADPR